MNDIFNSWLVNKPIAHRGLFNNEDIAENSISAFEKAIKENFPIELDVRATKDDVAVVFHDEKLSRMTGADGYVSTSNFEDIRKLKLLKSEDVIPTFEEVLKFVDGRVPLLVEIKNDFKVGELEKNVFKLLKNYNGEFAVQSFNPFTVEWFKNNAPNFTRGLLATAKYNSKLGFIAKFNLKRLRLVNICEPQFINYDIKFLPNRWVKKKNIVMLPLISYTIKSDSQYHKALKHCDNVIFEGFIPSI